VNQNGLQGTTEQKIITYKMPYYIAGEDADSPYARGGHH
jgi:hypothetical protein